MIATVIVLICFLVSISLIAFGMFSGEEDPLIIGSIFLVVLIFFGPRVIDGIDFNPYRAENAQQVCISRGFDNYLSYSGIFKTRAYGITCKYVTESRVNVNSQESIPIVIKTQ